MNYEYQFKTSIPKKMRLSIWDGWYDIYVCAGFKPLPTIHRQCIGEYAKDGEPSLKACVCKLIVSFRDGLLHTHIYNVALSCKLNIGNG